MLTDVPTSHLACYISPVQILKRSILFLNSVRYPPFNQTISSFEIVLKDWRWLKSFHATWWSTFLPYTLFYRYSILNLISNNKYQMSHKISKMRQHRTATLRNTRFRLLVTIYQWLGSSLIKNCEKGVFVLLLHRNFFYHTTFHIFISHFNLEKINCWKCILLNKASLTGFHLPN